VYHRLSVQIYYTPYSKFYRYTSTVEDSIYDFSVVHPTLILPISAGVGSE